jgi:cytochrome P450
LKDIKNLSDPHELKKLKYLDAVMNEALRLYGPANTFLLRQITNDSIRINDVLLPKGIYFGFEAVTIHTSEKYYENPF